MANAPLTSRPVDLFYFIYFLVRLLVYLRASESELKYIADPHTSFVSSRLPSLVSDGVYP
jgi:hypothetical protein